MSTNSSTGATKVVSRVANGDNIAVGPNEPVQAVRSLIQAIKTLASQSHFALLDSHFENISRLEEELNVKEDSLRAHKNVNETLAKEKGLVQTKAKERESAITELQGKNTNLQEKFLQLEVSSSLQKESLKKAGRKVKGLEKSLDDQKVQMKHLEESLEKESDEVRQLRREIERIRATNTSLSQKLEESDRQLAEFGNFTVSLVEEDRAVSAGRWESLWQRVYGFVEFYLKGDLPDISLKNGSAWEILRKPNFFDHRVPLPPTNSLAAKKMRIAVVATILARSIDRHICHSTYLFGDGYDARVTLLRQAQSNGKHESFCRGVLLAILPEENEDKANERVEKVMVEVMEHVEDLLPKDSIEGFTSDLERLVRNALEVWKEMRMTRTLFEPLFESFHFNDIEWLPLDFGGLETGETGETGQEPTSQSADDEELLVVFPRLQPVEGDQILEPVAIGTMLRKSQSLAAAQELKKQPQCPIIGRASGQRPRRNRKMSISSKDPKGLGIQSFLGL